MSTLTAPQVLHRLRAKGFIVTRSGEKLHLTPAEKLTPGIRAAVLSVKPRLLELLSDYPPLLCWSCGEEIAEAAPAGEGGVVIGEATYHIATCLPEGYLYDAAAGRVVRR